MENGNVRTGAGHMEPMLPDQSQVLEDLTFTLVASASKFAGSINSPLKRSIGDLVRAMNCYYSNLMEGHDTHLADIEKALRKEYSTEPRKRDLQLEAQAHIEVQQMIDHGQMPRPAISIEGIKWIHTEFCRRLPVSLLEIDDPVAGEKILMVPGEFRNREVKVGNHIAPEPASLDHLMGRFVEAYASRMLSQARKVVAVGASHHRFGWIHPFLDGNGRVGRLMSHAMLRELGVGSELWSISRGLSRNVERYKELFEVADEPKRGDLDGRGSLTEAGLAQFCTFFLEVCIDQVDFMSSLIQPPEMRNRMELWAAEEIRAKRLPKGSWDLLREALVIGEFPRSRVAALTGYQDRQARAVLSHLVTKGYLVSDTPRGAVRLSFPSDVVERWFPGLYKPGGISGSRPKLGASSVARAEIYGTLIVLMERKGWNVPADFITTLGIYVDEKVASQMLPKVLGAASLSDLLQDFSVVIPGFEND